METEGTYTDEDDNTHTGTIKKRHFVQNTFQYVLNLPVLQALLEKLPEVSPFDTYEKPMLGRPHKNRVKINDIKINRLILDDRSVKINDRSVKTNAPFYTQITQINTDLKDTYVVTAHADDNAHTPLSEHENHSHEVSSPETTSQQQASSIPIATTRPGDAPQDGDVTQANAPNKRRGSRTPKVKHIDESMTRRIDSVFDCLDELASEYAGEEFHYPPYKTDKDAIKNLLTSWERLTKEQVSDTYRFMMDSPASENGFLWSEHMSVKAFCKNFASQYQKMRKEQNKGKGKSANQSTPAPQEIPEGYVLWKGKVIKREDIETDFDKYVGNGKEERARLHQAALNDPEVAAILADMERAG